MIRFLRLMNALIRLHADPTTAAVHTAAAMAAEGPGLPAEELLAVAYVESRYQADSTSRVERGRRVTGAWPSTKQAGVGPWFCGPLQAEAWTWSDCLALREPFHGYRQGVRELRQWSTMCGGNADCILAGHAYGVRGLTVRGDYPGRVRVIWRAIGYRGGST
jgi:hypothetical protein